MDINKAKELLQQDLDDPGCVDISDLNEAQALAIEALKGIQAVRQLHPELSPFPLPGETKD